MDVTLRAYLDRMSVTPLLSLQEEVVLAERIQAGDDAARDQMICANLRLVAKIAYDYVNYGLPLEDLIAEGNVGLMKAVDRFDPMKGGKLSTYASWWIKQSIRRALTTQVRTIRLPVHLNEKLAKMRRIESSLGEELGREPTTEEIASVTGIEARKLEFLKDSSRRVVSLDAPLGNDSKDGATRGDLVADETISSPDTILCRNDLGDKLGAMLGDLDERELFIIQNRFGLGGRDRKTLGEVGEVYGVTRERIRQVQNIALKKLRRALARLEEPGLKSLLAGGEDDVADSYYGPN